MLETEHEELPLGVAADGCTMGTRALAAVPMTGRGLNLLLTVLFPARADAIKVFQIQFHDSLIMGYERYNKN